MTTSDSTFEILVLCTGNICRSPVAEAMLTQLLVAKTNVLVSSAGLAAPVGRKPHPFAVASAAELGFRIDSNKTSRQVASLDMTRAKLILVMDNGHKQIVRTRFPTAVSKTFLVGQWGQGQVKDPINMPAEFFRETASQLESCVREWVGRFEHLEIDK